MPRIALLLRDLGATGATANAKAELESAHAQHLQAALVARRVHQRSGRADEPLSSAAVARVA